MFRLPLAQLLNTGQDQYTRPLKLTAPKARWSQQMKDTEEQTRTYRQTRNRENNTVSCLTCGKTIAMAPEARIGFGLYQCCDCGEKEQALLARRRG